MTCQARRCNDQMMCGRCGLAWDVDDTDPPTCAPTEPDTVAVPRDWLVATLRGARAAGWCVPDELRTLLAETDTNELRDALK